MKLLKLLVHSIPAGALFALLLALLLFYLNPEAELGAAALWSTWLAFAAVYGLLAALLWPFGLLALRFFAERPLDLPWAGFAVFHRLHLVNLALAVLIWWANFLTTSVLLAAPTRRLLLAGCGLLSLVWVLGVGLSLQRVVFRTPGAARIQAALVAVLYVALIGLRAGAGGTADDAAVYRPALEELSAERRLTIIAVDGLSPDLIVPLVAEGKLPSFRRMMREGSWARVESFAPCIQPPIWTTVATGVLPSQHGIRDSARFLARGGAISFAQPVRHVFFRRLTDLGLFSQRPVTSRDRRRPALWNILDAFGMPVGVVQWWTTEPPEDVRGTIRPQLAAAAEGPWAAAPVDPGLAERVEERLARLADWSQAEEDEGEALRATVRWALERDLRALEQAVEAEETVRPTATLVYLPGLDAVQHRFLGYAFGASFWEGTGRPHPAYGDVVARYYRFLDEALAGYLSPEPGESRLLVVVSGFGVDRVPPWSLLVRAVLGNPGGEGYHDRAPAGALFAWGEGVEAGAQAPAVRPQDVLPTALYYLGLPVARDLDGKPRTDLFGAEFTDAQPLAYFPSYRGVETGWRPERSPQPAP